MADAPTNAATSEPSPATDPVTALRYLELSRAVYPELFAEFGKIVASHRVFSWRLDDPDFVAALVEFSSHYLEFIKYHPEAVELLETVAPRVMVERLVEKAEAYPEVHRRKFTEDLAQNYVKQVRAQGISLANEQAEAAALAQSLAEAASKTQAPAEFVQTALAQLEAGGQREALANLLEQRKNEVEQLWRDEEVVGEIIRDTLNAPVARPDIYAKVKTELLAENPQVNPLVLAKESERLTNVATALLADFRPDTEPAKINDFFQSFAESGLQKPLAWTADAALQFFGKEQQDEIRNALTGKAFGRVTDEKSAQAALGLKFVTSPVFKDLKESGNLVFGQAKPITAERNVIKQWLAATLKGPLGEVAGKPDRVIAGVFKLGSLGVLSPEFILTTRPSPPASSFGLVPGGTSFTGQGVAVAWRTVDLYLVAAYQRLPQTFHLDFSGISGWLLQRGGRAVAGKAIAAAAVKTGAKGVAGRLISSLLGTVVAPGVGTILGLIGGDVFTRPTGGVIGRVKNFFTSLGTGAGGFSFDRDLPLYLSILVISLIGLFVLPLSLLLLNNPVDTVRSTAFVTSGQQPVGGGLPSTGASFNYPNVPLPPASDITRCPVASGRITQGPGQGNHVGELADSYDLAVNRGTPVYPSCSGYVVAFDNQFAPGQHQVDSAGNFVRIECARADGQKYFLTYEHLLDVSTEIVAAAQSQTLVTTDTLLGLADDTGNSSGDHLHFQYNGPGTMILPAGCGT